MKPTRNMYGEYSCGKCHCFLSKTEKQLPNYCSVCGRIVDRKPRKTVIISGFPGIGKSFSSDLSSFTLDSDSSKFSWIEKGVRHPDFPQNYMDHIKRNIGKYDYILVSSHDVVRQALKDNDLFYYIVYPDKSCKEEYMSRYRRRGSDEFFQVLMKGKFTDFIDDIEKETYPKLVKLKAGEYLETVLPKIDDYEKQLDRIQEEITETMTRSHAHRANVICEQMTERIREMVNEPYQPSSVVDVVEVKVVLNADNTGDLNEKESD